MRVSRIFALGGGHDSEEDFSCDSGGFCCNRTPYGRYDHNQVNYANGGLRNESFTHGEGFDQVQG